MMIRRKDDMDHTPTPEIPADLSYRQPTRQGPQNAASGDPAGAGPDQLRGDDTTGMGRSSNEDRATGRSVPLTLHLVRHGRTRYNDECRVQGWCDSPLTVGGRVGVQVTARYLRDVPFVAAWTSPSGRARATGEMILAAHPG